MIIGMDFGTTNSGMAVYDGRTVNILPLDPANNNPRVARTALYLTNQQEIAIGRAAVDQYFTQNVGRSSRAKKVWVGEIEIRGGDMHYVTDVYVYVDVLSPGRLFLSIKTGLRDPDYPGSVVGQQFYSLEKLIGLYMHITKIRAERQLGQPLTQVVLGRPVRFARDPERDKLAQARLLEAAFLAGYETVYLQPEPIAAAYSYETSLDGEQNVLVFDFGGGTLDLTVMRLGNLQNRRVLATGGIPVAGDVFDQKLVRHKLPPHFGEGSYYGPRHKKLTVPPWIYDTFSNWQTILELQSDANRKILREIAQTAQRRYQIEMLEALVSSNYGQRMFDIVEQAKRQLSQKRGAAITLEGPGFKALEFVTRTEFERIIRPEIVAIEQHLDETLRASGLRAGQIDAVIRTGGSSQIPAFAEMLERKFGAEKVRQIDTFSSVTAGLGVMGYGIERGEIEARAYTPDDAAVTAESPDANPAISPANMDLLKRRILIQEGILDSPIEAEQILVFLGEGQQITAVPLNIPITQLSITQLPNHPITAALIAHPDEPLLIITSHYRFLLLTPRQLLERQSVNVRPGDVYMLGQRESLCSLSRWEEIKRHEKLLIVTSLGVTRPYPTRLMQENIEAPVPFKFDNQLFGTPALVTGAEMEDIAVLVTEKRRGARWLVGQMRGSGTQALNCGAADRVASALLCQPEDELLILTRDGYGRRLLAEWIPQPAKENSKGKSLLARRSLVTAVLPARHPDLWAVTNRRILSLWPRRVRLDDFTRSQPGLDLEADEMVQTVIMG
jgi:hypothetical chaperone protein